MRHLALKGRAFPKDLNPAGSVFGGWIMAKMDKAASIAVEDIVLSPAVTVAVTDLHFVKPISSGDIFTIYTEIVSIGESSINIEVEVMIQQRNSREEKRVTIATFTFVTVDEHTYKVPVSEVLRKDVSDEVRALAEKAKS